MNKIITIISLEKIKKKGQYKVYTTLDDYIFDEEIIAKYMIFKDKSYEEKEFKKIISEAEVCMNFNKALKYLSYGQKTKYEIINYLKGEKGIAQVINKLSKCGYLDDKKVAFNLLDYYKNNYKGPIFIKTRLLEKGIDKEIVEEVLKEYTYEDEKNICLIIIEKELGNLRKYPINKQKNTLLSKLVNKGFRKELVYSLVQNAHYIDESNESLIKDCDKLKSKYSNKELSSKELKQKLITSLLNKGYEYQKIVKILSK